MAIAKGFEKIYRIDGTVLKAAVDMCSWMYPGYGLQVSFVMEEGGGRAHKNNRALPFENVTEADIDALAAQVHLVPCGKCGKPAFDPASIDTNRKGQCEKCFMEELNAEVAIIQKIEDAKTAKRDAKMKAQGMKFKVIAWIHPPAGDDYMVEIYQSTRPSDAAIMAALRKRRSRILNDYSVTEL